MWGRCFWHDAWHCAPNLQCKDWASAFRKRTKFYVSVYTVDKGQNWQFVRLYTVRLRQTWQNFGGSIHLCYSKSKLAQLLNLYVLSVWLNTYKICSTRVKTDTIWQLFLPKTTGILASTHTSTRNFDHLRWQTYSLVSFIYLFIYLFCSFNPATWGHSP
jgi:hypothetical protein